MNALLAEHTHGRLLDVKARNPFIQFVQCAGSDVIKIRIDTHGLCQCTRLSASLGSARKIRFQKRVVPGSKPSQERMVRDSRNCLATDALLVINREWRILE